MGAPPLVAYLVTNGGLECAMDVRFASIADIRCGIPIATKALVGGR